jgi:S-adenosylmethionine synthetase
MARYIAKNIVASGAADRCEVQLAYAIGVARPVSVMLDTFGTGKLDDSVLADYIMDKVDMRPAAIISRFDLRRPVYGDLAAYGHMGREDLGAPWEKLDLAADIKAELKF